jgi:hypothetical protein
VPIIFSMCRERGSVRTRVQNSKADGVDVEDEYVPKRGRCTYSGSKFEGGWVAAEGQYVP